MIAREIYDYTSGYPYLVSRLCQLLDEMYTAGMHDSWTHAGILEAVRKLVRETNSLFEDMAKKVKDYPDLGTMLPGYFIFMEKEFRLIWEQNWYRLVPCLVFEG